MNPSLETQIETLERLIRRGCELRDALGADPSGEAALLPARAWQQDCALTIHTLSGGSKAHWLSRSYSQAFLVRSTAGAAVEGATPAEIARRITGVLEQALASLRGMRDGDAVSNSSEVEPRRFGFIHNPDLRPVVEQAYLESRQTLDQGRFGEALLTSCTILEAVVTDALEHKGLSALGVDWSFEERLRAAQEAGLIRNSCARLPAVALRYREVTDENGECAVPVSEREAQTVRQVLHVVMRDLDPGR